MRTKVLILLAACFVFAGCVQASVIFERQGDPLTTWTLGDTSNNTVATSWYQNFSSTGTLVQIFGLQPVDATTVEFQLLSGSVTGSLLASANVTLNPANGPGNYIVPFGPLTLAAGDYFLVASVPGAASVATLVGLDNGNPSFQEITDFIGQAGAGPEYISNNIAVADGGTGGAFQETPLDIGFSVTNVPEPSTWGFLLAGLGAAVLGKKRLGRRA